MGTKNQKSTGGKSSPAVEQAAGAAAPAVPGAAAAEDDGYQTIVVGVSKANTETAAKLDELAKKLGCKRSALIWSAVTALLANPPTTAPAGAAPNTGTAAGFWTVPVKDKSGKATAVKVVEVASRGDVDNGRNFYRYKREDVKERDRAKVQAVRSAKYDMDLLMLSGEPRVEELKAS